MVGCTLGLVSFSSINLAPGYPGAGLNPARCFAFAVARGSFACECDFFSPSLSRG